MTEKVGEGVAACMVAVALTLGGCSRSNPAPQIVNEEYHADNDIAMTVRSITDAFSVGEPLQAADYDFEGVLTDGEGRPLYTDIMGSPGQWKIEVHDPGRVRIYNIYLGDLLPDDLEQYLRESLGLDTPIYLEPTADSEDVSLTVYKVPGGVLKFESRTAHAANGAEGPLVAIVLLSDGVAPRR